MTRSKRMQPVLEVAARREQEAAKRLGDSQQRQQMAEQRLQELIHYRDDYARQFNDGGSLTAARLQDYRIFLDRLNQAIEQQRLLVQRAIQDCEAQRRRWVEVHGRNQALDKVVSRYRSEERTQEDLREQKESDEHSNSVRQRQRDDS